MPDSWLKAAMAMDLSDMDFSATFEGQKKK